MHFSTLFSLLLATGAIAAPISGLPVDTTTVTSLLTEVEKTGIPSLPVRGLGLPGDTPALPVDTTEVTNLIGEVTKVTGGAGLRERASLDLSSTVSTVNGLLGNVLTLINEVQADLETIVTDAESANTDGILSTVEGLLSQVISFLDTIPNGTGLSLGLSGLKPTLNLVTSELNGLVKTVDSLISKGLAGQAVTEVKSLLSQALTLVNGISL